MAQVAQLAGFVDAQLRLAGAALADALDGQ
jgi:hypothetical protein